MRSSYAHGQHRRRRHHRAAAMPGVLGVFTAADLGEF
jgi:CO/xanthine dehydrogenase Mo-binding subunit